MAEPIRIGVAGSGRQARHHRERLLLRGEFVVRPESEGGALLASDVEVLVIAADDPDRYDLARAALRAGRFTVFDSCLADEAAAARALVDLARDSGAGLHVLNERCWESEFLTAQAAVATNEMGRLSALRRVTWSPPLVVPDVERPDCGVGDVLPGLASLVDQALRLIRDRPARVYCVPLPDQIEKGASSGSAGFSLVLTFDGGATAHIEQNRGASLPFQTGWMVTGATGGFRKGRLFRRLPDGEVYDIPFEERPTNSEGMYDDLRDRVRQGAPALESSDHNILVATVVEAARRSASEENVVRL